MPCGDYQMISQGYTSNNSINKWFTTTTAGTDIGVGITVGTATDHDKYIDKILNFPKNQYVTPPNIYIDPEIEKNNQKFIRETIEAGLKPIKEKIEALEDLILGLEQNIRLLTVELRKSKNTSNGE